MLYQFLLQASTSVMEHQLILDFYLDSTGFGIISSSFYYSYILLQIPSGLLVQRFGPRKIMIFALFICAVASFAFGLSHNSLAVEMSRILMGVGCAPAIVSALTLAAKLFPPARFALMVGLTETLGMVGGAIGQEILGAIVAKFGWRMAVFLCGGLGLILLLLSWRMIKEKPFFRCYAGYAQKDTVLNIGQLIKNFLGLLKNGQLWIVGLVAGFVCSILLAFALNWSVPFLKLRFAIDLPQAAFASSLMIWGCAVGLPFFGWLAEKIGHKTVFLINTFLCLILLLVIIYWPMLSFILACILLFLIGFLFSCYALSFDLASKLVDEKSHGVVMAFTNMLCLLIGGWILQPLVGYLIDLQIRDTISSPTQLVAFQKALAVFPLSLFLALIFIFFMKKISVTKQIKNI